MKKKWTFVFFAAGLFLYSSSAFSESMYYEDEGGYDDGGMDYQYQEDTNQMDDQYNDSGYYEEEGERQITTKSPRDPLPDYYDGSPYSSSFYSRLPKNADYHGEKVIIVNPRLHVWGAYTAEGRLLRAGLATAGSSWCSDLHRSCRTKVGTFRINSLGNHNCVSSRYPLGKGGAPMPYCMYFNGNQGIHGSNAIAEANLSHGCVRVSVADAEWLRFHFVTVGTKVIVTGY